MAVPIPTITNLHFRSADFIVDELCLIKLLKNDGRGQINLNCFL